MDRTHISLACPVYNEGEKIADFIRSATEVLKRISESYEIVLVDDYSRDDTADIISEMALENNRIKLIRLSENSGQHIATAIALRETKGDYVVMMDSDFQISPSYIEDFYSQLKGKSKFDIISAMRSKRSAKLHRRLGSMVVTQLLNLLYKGRYEDIGSTFKMFTRSALDKLLLHDILIQNIPILVMSLHFKVLEVEVEYKTDNVQSRYRFSDLVYAIALAVLNFTTGASMLIFLIVSGVMMFFFGFLSVIALIGWGMIYQSVLPTNFLVFSLVVFIIGVLFILMGMIVLKLERINRNLLFRKKYYQKYSHDEG
jgi:undecaprenyl-phosphate 4-deoxy-4-formamido-L-arabinose transferase